MNKFLSAAVQRDDRKDNLKIMPISNADAEIWGELIIAIGKSGNQQLYDIASRYKSIADRDVYEDLLAYNTEMGILTEEVSSKENEYLPPIIIKIKDVFIGINHILKISTHDKYDSNKSVMIYELIINEDIRERIIFANTSILYQTNEARRLDIEKLKKAFEENGYKLITT